MLIANNCTRESGSFCGDQLCALKAAYLFVENQPNIERVIMSVSPGNEMHFLWQRFIDEYEVELVYDTWNPGDWESRWTAWNKWQKDREIDGKKFDHYRELYLRIHGAQRQTALCGFERGLGRKNIFEYWFFGQEHLPEICVGSDVYDVEIDHPLLIFERDVYVSPHCKTQGNVTFTFDYWTQVVHKLIDAGLTVTVGYDGYFCEDLVQHPLYKRHWGDHKQWMEQVCRHRIVACGNTGTGWLAAACGVPMITMEPHNSVMMDHRYRECGLRNLVEVVDGCKLDDMGNDMSKVADYVARRIASVVGKGDRYDAMQSVSDVCRVGALYSVNPVGKLKLMADEFLTVVGLSGDVADLGAYRGGTSFILRQLCQDKILMVVDTWTGNPHDDEMCHHKRGEWKASLADCQQVVGNSELTRYVIGTFPYGWKEQYGYQQFCFVYVDMDTYQATRDAIEFFWPRLVPGGKIFFDDYDWLPCAGVRKAVDVVFAANQRRVVQSQYTCIVEKS